MHLLLLQSQPLEPESLLISSIDDELWNEFSHAFSKDLKAVDRNSSVLHFILLSASIALIVGIHVKNAGIADPRLVIIFVLVGIGLVYGYLSFEHTLDITI